MYNEKDVNEVLSKTIKYLDQFEIKWFLPDEIKDHEISNRQDYIEGVFFHEENIIVLRRWCKSIFLHEFGHALDYNINIEPWKYNQYFLDCNEYILGRELVAGIIANKLSKQLQIPIKFRFNNEVFRRYKKHCDANLKNPFKLRKRIRDALLIIK